MILNPISITKDKTVADAMALMAEFKIGGIPVVDNENRLVGIVTDNDLRFERDLDKKIDLVMTKDNLVTTRQTTGWKPLPKFFNNTKSKNFLWWIPIINLLDLSPIRILPKPRTNHLPAKTNRVVCE